jgi:malonate-semialdehyde dehydrogenase (acetylating)/methylmalonate-semialdehyde dehydrogenase
MAISVAILVGESQQWVDEIVEKSRKLTVGPGNTNADIPPINTIEAKKRVESLIE